MIISRQLRRRCLGRHSGASDCGIHNRRAGGDLVATCGGRRVLGRDVRHSLHDVDRRLADGALLVVDQVPVHIAVAALLRVHVDRRTMERVHARQPPYLIADAKRLQTDRTRLLLQADVGLPHCHNQSVLRNHMVRRKGNRRWLHNVQDASHHRGVPHLQRVNDHRFAPRVGQARRAQYLVVQGKGIPLPIAARLTPQARVPLCGVPFVRDEVALLLAQSVTVVLEHSLQLELQ
mmetsp:Transcript_34195/g.98603  ORF Transcript_34195/g.98603 Transcript_34195/m.98603 type:complete len:234 (-) Transcript_34195:244-945(-)